MNSCDRLVGFRSPERVEQFHEPLLVGIAHWASTVWLDPFGMLYPQVAVDLLPEVSDCAVIRGGQARWPV